MKVEHKDTPITRQVITSIKGRDVVNKVSVNGEPIGEKDNARIISITKPDDSRVKRFIIVFPIAILIRSETTIRIAASHCGDIIVFWPIAMDGYLAYVVPPSKVLLVGVLEAVVRIAISALIEDRTITTEICLTLTVSLEGVRRVTFRRLILPNPISVIVLAIYAYDSSHVTNFCRQAICPFLNGRMARNIYCITI